MLLKLNQLLSCLAAVIIFSSCDSNEIGESKDVNPETIYQLYRFEYNENDTTAELFAQFRFAGENGTTLVLTTPSKFEYNGAEVKVDSNDFSGAFYKTSITPKEVVGMHKLAFTDINGKVYQNIFTVDSFVLPDVPKEISKLVPAIIKFQAPPLYGEDYIELRSEETDSAFSVKYNAAQKDGYITIPKEELQRQKKDILLLTATLHRKVLLQQQVKEGGGIWIEQTIKPVSLKLKKETF